ncbi:Fanconi anemia group J protein-like [Hondaea fermentalgiana]|uniref:Fanconi anemia group J protein-like n=1 Tax=Hondaea fermentalgiana TaxID=2315210 RepID=A0A2R5GSH0_9STRA|nr:Fanconi anemia group J protein-like [Hondaea fermentalgiana]|eukprot:GBG30824.1 Fanconi anemia group J protein-like [Hondaea fermentalgiana]
MARQDATPALAGKKEPHVVRVASVAVHFPAGKRPFPTQLALMARMVAALRAGENALLESPTGTGKALAALCGVLSWQRHAHNEARASARARSKENKRRRDAENATPPDRGAAVSSPATCTCDLLRSSPTSKSKYFGAPSAPKFSLLDQDEESDDDNDGDDADENDFETLNGRRVRTPKGVKRKRDAQKRRDTCAVHGRGALDASKPDQEKVEPSIEEEDDLLPSSMRVKLSPVPEPSGSSKRHRVFIASRTHGQLAQLAAELKGCPDDLVRDVRMVILGSRKQYCVNGKVTRKRSMASAAARNEECRRLIAGSGPGCGYFKPSAGSRLRAATSKDSPIWDIEDLVDAGKRLRCCPYFATREMASASDLIFTPYNYLFEPSVREAMGIDLSGAVLVIDEAHNIADVCRAAASTQVLLPRLEQVRDELEQLATNGELDKQAAYSLLGGFVRKVFTWAQNRLEGAPERSTDGVLVTLSGLEALLQLEADCGLDEDALETVQQIFREIAKATSLAANHEQSESNGDVDIEATLLSPFSRTVLEGVLGVFDFMLADHRRFASDYRVVIRNEQGPQGAVQVCFWCMNAAAAFEPVAKQCHSVILTSGTLAPLTSFASELGTPFKFTLEAPHVIDVRKQMFAGVVAGAPPPESAPTSTKLVRLEGVFANKSRIEYQDALGCALVRLLQAVPDGALCFFPSYSFMRTCVHRWRNSPTWAALKRTKSQVFVEASAMRQAGDAEDGDEDGELAGFDGQLDKFRAAVDRGGGALFLGVFRGKLSEGLNFSDRAARAVFVCGIPFPNARDPAIQLKKDFQDKVRASTSSTSPALSGHSWYSQQAYRALNQALGRVIRHKNDFGAVIFLDARFDKPEVQRNLPKWMRGVVKTSQPIELTAKSLTEFFGRQKPVPALVETEVERFDKSKSSSRSNADSGGEPE